MSKENFSILEQIINNQKAEDVDNLDAIEIIDNLFAELSDREKDVLIRRYGLHTSKKETLESIGNAHNLTRERIRQIETSSVKKLQQLENLGDFIDSLKKVVYQLLEEHGGLMERDYLLELLVGFSTNGVRNKKANQEIHKNYLNFLITKLLHKEFEEVNNSKVFKEMYKLKYQEFEHLEEIAAELTMKLREISKVHTTSDIMELAGTLESYKKHEEKVNTDSGLDIGKVLNFDMFEEDVELINANKVLYSILKATKKVEQNKFGYWGIHNWREIKPKTINDKIYLILKNHGKPLHFAEIAGKINDVGFDHKNANAATVHNELILDKKYVLVGRGLYALKEWGYKDGAVADVISEILVDQPPLTRDELIEKVLEKRLVKKATIILALMNKKRFNKIDGKYQLIS